MEYNEIEHDEMEHNGITHVVCCVRHNRHAARGRLWCLAGRRCDRPRGGARIIGRCNRQPSAGSAMRLAAVILANQSLTRYNNPPQHKTKRARTGTIFFAQITHASSPHNRTYPLARMKAERWRVVRAARLSPVFVIHPQSYISIR